MNNSQYIIGVLLVVLYLAACHYIGPEPIPDFAAIKDVNEKKTRFFEYVYPRIEDTNIQLINLRGRLEILQNKLAEGNRLTRRERIFIQRQLDKFANQHNDEDLTAAMHELLIRVDIVPPSLALAQSANESAWGTSRFARQGLNYFGQWCYSPGCGIVPLSRDRGAVHEVRRYSSVQESVSSYIDNINSGSAFGQLRSIRASERARRQQFQGYGLAVGLDRYSQRGGAYVEEIRDMIRINRLHEYDDRFWRAVELNRRQW